MKDPYKTLGVSPESSPDEIKKAYRKLAKKYHPDSTGGDKAKESRFKDISTAYDIVGDADKRAQYDAMRRGGLPPGFGPGGPGGHGGPGGPGVFDLGDLFSQMFAGGRPARGARGGRRGNAGNVEYRVHRGPEGFPGFEGFEVGEPPPRPRPAASEERKIRASDGSVLLLRGDDVYSDVRLGFDQATLGTVVDVPTVAGKATVKIPPGTSSGVKLRLKGKGAPRPGGAGDHFVTVQIEVPKHLDDEAKRLMVELMQRVRGRHD